MTDLRRAVERRSSVLLVHLTRQPKLLVPGLTLVLLVAGGLLPPAVGVPCLLVVLAFIGWLSYLSWPVLDPRGRLLRTVSLAVLTLLVASRF